MVCELLFHFYALFEQKRAPFNVRLISLQVKVQPKKAAVKPVKQESSDESSDETSDEVKRR